MAAGFSGRLLANLSKLKKNEEGCDVELISKDGMSFSAHRIILAASSDHLRTLLFKHPQKRKFNLHNVDSAGLKAVIGYVYGDALDLSSTNKSAIKRSLLPAFESLGLTEAVQLCEEHLKGKGQEGQEVKSKGQGVKGSGSLKKTAAQAPLKRKRGQVEEEEAEVDIVEEQEDEVGFVDDDADEDFVPPGKRRKSPRRPVKPGVQPVKSEAQPLKSNAVTPSVEASTQRRKTPKQMQVKTRSKQLKAETKVLVEEVGTPEIVTPGMDIPEPEVELLEVGTPEIDVDDFIELVDNGKHKCTKCDSEFPKLKIARHHVRYICGFTDKKYKCQICGKGFAVMRYVTDHERRTHGHYRSREGSAPDVNKLQCSLCYTLFDSKENIGAHLKEMHRLDSSTVRRVMEELGAAEEVEALGGATEAGGGGSAGVQAQSGTAATPGVRQRRQAIRAELLDKNRPHGCAMCGARFSVKRYLNDHHRRVHGIKSKNGKVEEDFSDSVTVLSTEDCKTIRGSYKCPDCATVCRSIQSFEEHRGLDIVGQVFECPCEGCPEMFNCSTLWEQHQLWRHDPKPKYQCVKCGLLYTRAIKNHVRKCKLEPGFVCERCEVNFRTKSLLRNHFCKNTARPIVAGIKRAGTCRFRCGACGRGFVRLPDLLVHKYRNRCRPAIRPGSKVKAVKRCKNLGCKRVFHHQRALLKHKRMCDKAECVMCDICGRVLPTNRIMAHKRTHKEFTCAFCSKAFKTVSAFTQHKGNGHFQCELCGDVSQCEGLLRSHMVFHGGNKKYTCNCGLKFKNIPNMKKHQQKCKASSETSKLYQCEECGVEFKTLMSLKSHSFIHTNPSKYQCTLCQRCFGTAAAFYSHKRNVHKDLTHECPTCKKHFLSLNKLNEHHDRVHKGITHKFECDKCGEKFSGEYKFGKHMRDFHMESIFKCPNCNQGFGYKSHLKDHIERCTGRMKMVKCEICNKTMQKTTYREHVKMHVTPKRFVCSKCGRGFDHKWLVGNHACKNAGTYVCNICGQKQKTIHGYRIHMNQHIKSRDPGAHVVEGDTVEVAEGTETRAIEAFMGPDGQIYLPEGTVLAEGEELVLEGGEEGGQPLLIKSEYPGQGELDGEVELVQTVKDPSGTELVLSGADGDERYIVQVIDEDQQGTESVTMEGDITDGATPIEAQDVRYVQLADGESVIQISIDGNTTLMLPCDKN